MPEISQKTNKKSEVVDITDEVNVRLKGGGDGVCHLFIKHTTAVLTVADLDPGTDLDMLDAFRGMIPDLDYRHPHDPSHVPDHILSAMIGPALTVPIRGGELSLGTWQRVVLLEFDGPRERNISCDIIPSAD
jgi:secondary thiamine-phosphate synthase enzyme